METDLLRLKEQLDALNHEALQQAERIALRKVGNLMLEAILEKAPIRTEYDGGDLKPGELKAGFKASVHIASDEASVGKDDHSRVTVKPNAKVAHVARFVEDGHANPRSSKHPNTPAHPFVRPAFAEKEQEAIELYSETMTTAIKDSFNA